MYMSAFIDGVLATIIVEIVLVFVAAIVAAIKRVKR